MDKNRNADIGRRIRVLREKNSLSQTSLAKKLNITQGRISQIEKGASIPDTLISSLCSVFNVDRSFLIDGIDTSVKTEDDIYLDRGENYRNAVSALLNKHAYKKAKHPVCPYSPKLDLPVEDPIYKAISRLLRKTDATITAWSKAIYDDDAISGTGDLIYPAMKYTFAIRCIYFGYGYKWEAFEINREADTSEIKKEENDSSFFYDKRIYPDEAGFEPYYFSYITPLDIAEKIDNPKDRNKPYYLTRDQLYRYREALSKAKADGVHAPENPFDNMFINRYAPDTHRRNENGEIDIDAEFSDFIFSIEKGVTGKALTEAHPLRKSFRDINSVIFSGYEHSLGSRGKVKISVNSNGETEFQIDDRIITGEQFLKLLQLYEGFTMKFDIID